MEAKLKALKVVDLKDILAKANQQPPPKATKTDLIARILASKDATAVYNQKFPPKDDLLAPPEEYVSPLPIFPSFQPSPQPRLGCRPGEFRRNTRRAVCKSRPMFPTTTQTRPEANLRACTHAGRETRLCS
jgi:hypothetical protein